MTTDMVSKESGVPKAQGSAAQPKPAATRAAHASATVPSAPPKVPEIGGPKGPEPTRYADWERDGRCVDF
jgi:hypothetical protein